MSASAYPPAAGPLLNLPSGFPIPADPCLDNLPALLDSRRIAGWLSEALAEPDVRATPRYLRYKPANKATLLYEVQVKEELTWAVISIKVGNAKRDLRRPEAATVAARARDRCLSPKPLMFLPEPRAMVEWYPARVSIPGLAFDRERLGEALSASGHRRPLEEPVLVTYKPERRAVLRWGSVYLKAYAATDEYQLALRGADRSSALAGLGAPSAVAWLPEERLVALEAVAGVPEAPDLGCLGKTLAILHRSPASPGLPVTDAGSQLELARSAAGQLAWLVPELEEPLASLLAVLSATVPAATRMVPSHGDLHLGQAITTSGGVALLDFDHMCLASPALDPARLAAHLVLGGKPDLQLARAALDELLAGYGLRIPYDLPWYLAVSILGRALFPLRLLHADWPGRLRQMVADAHEALAA